MKLPVGVDDYKKLIQQFYDHVDKSLFIKAFLDESAESTLITRPRRFGKTLNMSMLYYFFSNQYTTENRLLFVGKQIESAQTSDGRNCMDFQGQYPTIFLTFKNIRPKSFEEAKEQIAKKMSGVYGEHLYLFKSERLNSNEKKLFNAILNRDAREVDLQCALEGLSKYLHKHYEKRVVILLDEYDTPFHAAYTAKIPFHQDFSDFMKVFLGSAFKGNLALEKAMLTGILRVSLMDSFSGANSIAVMSMLSNEYETFFGFTLEETHHLISANSAGLTAAEISLRLDVATQWYNGYLIGTTLLYNPWSVISYLYRNCKPDVYWNASGEDSVLGRSLLASTSTIREKLCLLLENDSVEVSIDEGTVFADLTRNEKALWGLMLYSGYLKVIGDNENPMNRLYQVSIPNFEVRLAYKHMVDSWFGATNSNDLFNCLWQNNLSKFKEILTDYLEQTVSYHDLGPKTAEKVYHVLFLGMFFSLQDRYIIDSNKEYGHGRYDIILIPKDKSKPGYLFEFKATDNVDKLAEEVAGALEQMTEARYGARLKQENITSVHHVGIAFCGKAMQMGSELYRYDHTSDDKI